MGMMWAFSSQAPVAETGGKVEDSRIRRHEGHGIFDLVFREEAETGMKANGTTDGVDGDGSKSADEKMQRRTRVMRAHVVFMVRFFPYLSFCLLGRRLTMVVESRMDGRSAYCGPYRPLRTVRPSLLLYEQC